MFKQFFAGMEWTALPLFALALFMVMFALVVLRTFAFKTTGDFQPHSVLPLSDGNGSGLGGAADCGADLKRPSKQEEVP